MKKGLSMFAVLGVVLLIAATGCGGKGGGSASGDGGSSSLSPVTGNNAGEKLIGHYDNMLRILRDNKADPEEARAELAAYQTKYATEIENLGDEIEKMSDEDQMKVIMKFSEKIQELESLQAEIYP